MEVAYYAPHGEDKRPDSVLPDGLDGPVQTSTEEVDSDAQQTSDAMPAGTDIEMQGTGNNEEEGKVEEWIKEVKAHIKQMIQETAILDRAEGNEEASQSQQTGLLSSLSRTSRRILLVQDKTVDHLVKTLK